MKKTLASGLGALALVAFSGQPASAWDYEGHRLVNELALASLPTNFPAFVKSPVAAERIAFLAGEPDRWRNAQDLPLRHCNGPEHYIDLEELAVYGLKPELLPVFRYEFVAQLALVRKAHPEKFPEVNAARNEDHTRELVGLLPWTIAENYSKLKSGFSYLKAYQDNGGTPDEIANAQANLVYVMGVMGHYVGDASQPLHTTIHHHGWVGENPHNYSSSTRIHSWIDGGYFFKVGGANLKEMESKLRLAQLVSLNGRSAKPEEMFQAALTFLIEQNKLVEPLYQMEKDGRLSGEGDKGLEGKAFLEAQLLKSGQLLGDIWYSAWQQAPPDTFLIGQLARRKHEPAESAEKK
ncbi:MAG TPA: hypothetical protein VN578_01660 [Candidatus Binatia bacterium]|jgi:hypothetical protein|nr:hypothetical protein [Candidatus Binatia bacterium]